MKLNRWIKAVVVAGVLQGRRLSENWFILLYVIKTTAVMRACYPSTVSHMGPVLMPWPLFDF